jgi:chromosome segregation ATPase
MAMTYKQLLAERDRLASELKTLREQAAKEADLAKREKSSREERSRIDKEISSFDARIREEEQAWVGERNALTRERARIEQLKASVHDRSERVKQLAREIDEQKAAINKA